MKEKWWKIIDTSDNCPFSGDGKNEGISIHNIGGIFIVTFVGIGMAFGVLIIEFFYMKYCKKYVILQANCLREKSKKIKNCVKIRKRKLERFDAENIECHN